MFRVFQVRPYVTAASIIVLVACVGNLALAETMVLCPTAVTATYADPREGYFSSFDKTINNSGLSTAVDSGVAPTSWPTSSTNGTTTGDDGVRDQGRYYNGDVPWTDATLTYTVPTSVTGYSALEVTGIRLWNYNESWDTSYYNGRGIASAMVEYSTNAGSTWSAGQSVSFTQAPAQSTTTSELVALSGLPIGVDRIRFGSMQNFDSSAFLGFNEVRFMGVAESVPEPGAVALLITGLISLLAYAWRKRK